MTKYLLIAGAALVVAGCAEPDQTKTGTRAHVAPWEGTKKPYVATGWTPGDRNSWEQHLKVRTQQGQNDYAKVN